VIVRAVVAACDGCAVEQREGGDEGRFETAEAALGAAERLSWVRRLSGRLLCPVCADRQRCRSFGHDYEPGSWRVCACDRSIPEHDGHEPWQDPSSWEGCGWLWRLCGRCDHIDERHVTARPSGLPTLAEREYEAALDRGEFMGVQPGDGFLAEVAAGLGLPNHQQVNGENAMVEANRARPAGAPAEAPGGEVR
jgi:hypothetical protein